MENQHALILDAIFRRRSIRRYADTPVEADKLHLLLEAAMAAPSACNLKPWEFIVVTEPEQVNRLRACIGRTNGRTYNAPAVLVVCGNTGKIPWQGDAGQLDCAAAIENLMIAAPALGLGTVWIGDFDPPAVKALLGIPEQVQVISLVCLGYPAEAKEPRTQYDPACVHWQSY
ncbi:MAG: nitroreductase family protein [Anaerolineae bacterium]